MYPHLAMQILIAVIVTLWINWAHFMSWASAGSHEMMLAAQGLAGREHRYAAGLPCRISGTCNQSQARVCPAWKLPPGLQQLLLLQCRNSNNVVRCKSWGM